MDMRAFMLGRTLFGGTSRPPAAPAPQATVAPAEPSAAQILFDLKREALARATATAKAEGNKPTLTDYFAAAIALGEERNLPSEQWNPKSIADLSGMEITGFNISEPPKAKPGMQDMYDQDGDGQINSPAIAACYQNVRLVGAELKDCFVQPATSFNDQIGKAKTIENVTFSGMKEGDSFTFGAGQYTNIRLENINGGAITFARGARVTTLDMQDATTTSITLGEHSLIDRLNATGATIVTLNAEPKSEIRNAVFAHTTIAMASEIKGLKINNAAFVDTNLAGVTFDGVQLNNVHFTNVAGLNLDCALIGDNVTLNGQKITAARDVEMYNQISAIRTTMATAWGNGTSAANTPFSGIIPGVSGVDIADTALQTHIATMPRTVDVANQATPANMAAFKEQ